MKVALDGAATVTEDEGAADTTVDVDAASVTEDAVIIPSALRFHTVKDMNLTSARQPLRRTCS